MLKFSNCGASCCTFGIVRKSLMRWCACLLFRNFLNYKAKVIFNFGNHFKIMKLIFFTIGFVEKSMSVRA
jgi:hypothetical protein